MIRHLPAGQVAQFEYKFVSFGFSPSSDSGRDVKLRSPPHRVSTVDRADAIHVKPDEVNGQMGSSYAQIYQILFVFITLPLSLCPEIIVPEIMVSER